MPKVKGVFQSPPNRPAGRRGAMLPTELEKQAKEKYPHLLKEPKREGQISGELKWKKL